MNIFAVDKSPTVAAISLHDAHVRKMIVETSQMLANAFTLEELKSENCPHRKDGLPRKHSYVYHPCSKWALESTENYNWLLIHGIALCYEFEYRFDKKHFTSDFIHWVNVNWKNKPNEFCPLSSSFTLCMPDKYKCDDPIKSYRNYYIGEKLNLRGAIWTKRNKPHWITNENHR